jgi:hypothetical protein
MRTILVAFGLMISIQVIAQTSFGVKVGANINAVRSEPEKSFFGGKFKPTIAYHAGVFVVFSVWKDKFALEPELTFTQRGYAIDLTYGTDDLRYNLNYLELPILLSYSPVNWLWFQAGPNFAYKLSAKSNFDNQYFDADYLFDNSVDYGGNIGFKVKLFGNFAIVARYYHGLAKITETEFRDENNVPLGSMKQYNTNGEISIAYKIK